MPTQQPNNAPDDEIGNDAREEATPAAVLSDDDADEMPGGGGLGGAAAADPLGGSGRTPAGNARNAPIDVPVPQPGGDPAAEARVRAVTSEPDEPRPSSQ